MKQRNIITGRVNADGTIAAGTGFTVRKGSTAVMGSYWVTFPGRHLISLTPTPISGGNAWLMHSGTYTTDTCNAQGVNTGGTGVDMPFTFVAEVV